MLRFPLKPSVSMKANTYTKDTVALIDLDQKTGMTSRCSFDHFIGKNKQQAAGCEKEHGGFGRPCEKWAQARSAYSFFGSDACNAALAFSSVSSPCIVRRSVSSTEVSSKF
jgi:hypothetical protein